MGVNKGASALYHVHNISFSQFHSLAGTRAIENGRQGKPAVAIDMNWLCHKFKKKSGLGETIHTASGLILKLLAEGIGVFAVFDPVTRHHSKKASVRRIFDRQKAVYDSIRYKTRIMTITQQLRDKTYDTMQQEEVLQTELKDLEKKVKSRERDCLSGCAPEYVSAVKEAVENLTGQYQNLTVTTGKFQADSVIQHYLSSKRVDFAFGNDADFSFVVGEPCLQIKSFKLTAGKNKKGYDILEIVIAGPSQKVCQDLCNHLGIETDGETNAKKGSPFYKPAEFPILDGISDVRSRCLMAVVLGSDTLPSEMKAQSMFNKMGCAAIRDSLQDARSKLELPPGSNVPYDDLYQALMGRVPKQNQKDTAKQSFTASTIGAFVDAMAYEPAASEEYVHGPPTHSVSQYIKEFAPSNAICQECDLIECPGPCEGSSHLFMKDEGSATCSKCERSFCLLCTTKESVCLPCLSQNNVALDPISRMSSDELIAALSEKMEVPRDAPISLLQELYSTVIEGGAMDSLDDALLDSVKYPLESANALTDGTLRIIKSFDVRDGAGFLADPCLTTEHRAALMRLFAKLVTFTEKKGPTLPECAEVLPDIIVDFCNGSRIDSGERLMKRCVRHAFDTTCPSILHATASVFEYKGEVGLLIHDKISPSFTKGDPYRASVAFTESAIVSNSCGCKAGDQKKSFAELPGASLRKHMCVHCNPVILKTSTLLMDGLAQHVLVEMAAHFTPTDEATLSENKRVEMAKSIRVLIAAADEPEAPLDLVKPTQLLQHFKVATEKNGGKRDMSNPPHPSELGPLRDFERKSNEATAKKRLKLDNNDSKPTSKGYETPAHESTPSPPNHITTYRLSNIVREWCGKSRLDEDSDIVGHRILGLRAEDAISDRSTLKHIDASLKKDWSELVEKASKRERRCVATPRTLFGTDSRKGNHVESGQTEPVDSSAGSDKENRAPANMSPELKRKREASKGTSKRCISPNCGKVLDGRKARRVPPIPDKPKPDKNGNIRNRAFMSYGKKVFKRKEYLRRLAIPVGSPLCESKGLRICADHPVIKVRKHFPCSIWDPKTKEIIETKTATDDFEVPDDAGPKSNRPGVPTVTPSKGIGCDRSLLRALRKAKAGSEFNLALQQTAEIADGGRTAVYSSVNAAVRKEAGLDVHGTSPDGAKKNTEEKERKLKDPVVDPRKIDDKEVKRRTGFATLADLLTHICIVSNGDIERMKERESSLTWFEEWLLYFEMTWGRTSARWIDLAKSYGTHDCTARDIFRSKLKIVVRVHRQWPTLLSHAEDVKLRSEKWRERYKDKRVVMWDNTNIDFQGKPSDPDLQRQTHSQYYGGNVAKGGGGIFAAVWMDGRLGTVAWCHFRHRILSAKWATRVSRIVPEGG